MGKGMNMEAEWAAAHIYLAGEVHGVPENTEIKYELLEALVLHNGVNKLLVEMGYFDSLGINEYLMTGREEILYNVLGKYGVNYVNTEKELEFWKKVYLLNARLAERGKIRVIGVDCVGKIDSIYRYLLYLTENKRILKVDTQEDIGALLGRKLRDFRNAVKNGSAEVAEALAKELKALVQSENPAEEQDCLRNLLEELLAHGRRLLYPERRREIREDFLYERIREEVKKGGKLFGQFGCAHICSDYSPIPPAAERLAQDMGERCVRIVYLYNRCEYFVIRNGRKEYRELNTGDTSAMKDLSLGFSLCDGYHIIRKGNLYYIFVDNKRYSFFT